MRSLLALLAMGLSLNIARADDTADKCQALRDLNADYRGRSLSLREKAIKVQMVAWYRANCQTKRSDRAKAKLQ
jgi:hypothetical protein